VYYSGIFIILTDLGNSKNELAQVRTTKDVVVGERDKLQKEKEQLQADKEKLQEENTQLKEQLQSATANKS